MSKLRSMTGVLMCATMACATQSSPGAADIAPPGDALVSRGSPDVITLAELSDPALGNPDALTIIKRLRPAFLKSRGVTSANTPGGEIHVIINDGPFLTTAALQTISAREIAEIRYFGMSAAAQRYGSRAAASPVIVIRTK